MFSKKNQPKLSPEERKKQEDREKEEKRRGQIIKDRLYPLLVEHTKSVSDCKMFLQMIDLVIDQAFMNLKRNMKVSDLKLLEEMKDNEEAVRWRAVHDIFASEDLSATKDILTSMANIITNNEKQEQSERKLQDLPLRFITYENK